MRRPVDRERLSRFLRAFGREVGDDVRVYLTGGAKAVLYGWRTSTIDVDLKPEPEADSFFRALPALKERRTTWELWAWRPSLPPSLLP